MTIRSRFTLIALCLVLPSVFWAALFIYTRSDSWELERPYTGKVSMRRWVESELSGNPKPYHDLEDFQAAAIRRDDGLVVFSSARGLPKGEVLELGAFLERALAAYPGMGYISESVDGEIGGSYVVVLGREIEPWYHRGGVIGIAILLALECLVVVVGVVVTLRTSSRILGLGGAARRIARGDLAFALKREGDDEVARLYRDFDEMRKDLVEAKEGRSRFLMSVSHDLRTPLTSIKGYLQALEEGMARDPATRRKFLGILRSKAELLEGRIQEIIEFAGLETAVRRAKLEDLRLRDFLEEIARAAASDAEVADRKFSSSVRVGPDSTVKADPRLFLRVLENLLSNAIRYTRPGDELSLDAGEDSEGFWIAVRDKGPGIAKEDRARIFDEFYRGSRARNEEGLGLGLSIVRSIASAHGWKVRLAEGDDEGTAFVIEIPKAAAIR